ncbi:MAG: sulfotransferase family protein [Planctomycetota bacterium]|jgi:hypothetical protein
MTHPNDPFFIAGCVRSGTTLLRRILVRHPRLECPQETHFFRWADPFGSLRFANAIDTKLLHKHRGMDGVDEQEFREIVSGATNRRELAEGYARCYMRKQGNPDGRWFDKTPQNVYGLLLLRAVFPDAPIVHIHRHPLNVVASLLEGKVMPAQPFSGALNYWVESAQIFGEFGRAWPQHLVEVSYEELTSQPRRTLATLLSRLGEDPDLLELPNGLVHPERNRYRDVLSAPQADEVIRTCGPWLGRYGYDGQPAETEVSRNA